MSSAKIPRWERPILKGQRELRRWYDDAVKDVSRTYGPCPICKLVHRRSEHRECAQLKLWEACA